MILHGKQRTENGFFQMWGCHMDKKAWAAGLDEFSCGALSGWMYRVNGEFPNYGCSRYRLSDGDKIEWVYTCNLGKDVGCEWMSGEGPVSQRPGECEG